jgi:hypothetical protein
LRLERGVNLIFLLPPIYLSLNWRFCYMVGDRLVRRGELILLLKAGERPEEELGRMNEGKGGGPSNTRTASSGH